MEINDSGIPKKEVKTKKNRMWMFALVKGKNVYMSCDDCDECHCKNEIIKKKRRMNVQTKFIEQCLIAFADKIIVERC